MQLSDFLKIIHSYIGTDCDKQDYIPYIINLVMREPSSDKEIEEDNRNEYYPYSGRIEEKDFLLRVYNGSKTLPKKKAAKIKSRYDSAEFLNEFNSIEAPARALFVREMATLGIACTEDELPEICEDLLRMLIDAAVLGIKEIDPLMVGKDELTITPVYDDQELKKKYSIHLLDEVSNHCPNDGCFKKLYLDNAGRSSVLYQAVIINPRMPIDTVDNIIAMCPECAENYRFNLSKDSIDRMTDIKLKLSLLLDARNAISDDKIVSGVGRVIQKIPSVTLEQTIELNYNPTEVIKKMDKTDASLFIKIKGYVNGYYTYVMDFFKQMEREENLNFERFCQQIKHNYRELSNCGLSQSQIFDELVNWLAGETNEETEPCEVVISYFVQKCEVYDVISR